MIPATGGKLHWNYLIALEKDLEVASRYVEFCKSNYRVFSIEFAHLLFAAASEVDVVAKLLCERLDPAAPRQNMKRVSCSPFSGLLQIFPHFRFSSHATVLP